MKKHICLLLCLLLTTSLLWGCGKNKEVSSNSEGNGTVTNAANGETVRDTL